MLLLAGLLSASFAQSGAVDAQRGGSLELFEPGLPCTTTYATRQEAFPAARASSALTEGSLRHGPERAIDGNLGTAWVEGVGGAGHGQSLQLKLPSEGAVPEGIWVVPGYAKDAGRWTKNRRVSVLEVRFLKAADGVDPEQAWALDKMVPTDTEPLRVTFLTEGGSVPLEGQAVPIAGHFVHNMEITEVVALELVIIDTDGAGAKYEDTCISEVTRLSTGDASSVSCSAEWCASPDAASHPGCR